MLSVKSETTKYAEYTKNLWCKHAMEVRTAR